MKHFGDLDAGLREEEPPSEKIHAFTQDMSLWGLFRRRQLMLDQQGQALSLLSTRTAC